MTATIFRLLAASLALVAFVLALDPGLDIAVSRLFWTEAGGFAAQREYGLQTLREFSMVPTILVGLACLGSIIVKLVFPSSRPFLPLRASLFIAASILIAPLILVNGVLKEHWERARPVQITQFGGTWQFTPWWQPGNGRECIRNCSFVSGEASGAAVLLAPALVAPAAFQPVAMAAVAGATVMFSTMRIAFGGHFFSDVVLAILLTLVVVERLHWWFYRRVGAATERDLDATLAGIGDAAFAFVAGIAGAALSLAGRLFSRRRSGA